MVNSSIRIFLWILLAFLPTILSAQEKPIRIFLLRHAEKMDDGTSDPPLSSSGESFSVQLDNMLREVRLDVVYTTPYQRAELTAKHIAARNALPVKSYDPFDMKALLKQIDEISVGNIIVVGHANTVPMLINTLFPQDNMPVMKETDYGHLFIINYYKDRPELNNYFILNTALSQK